MHDFKRKSDCVENMCVCILPDTSASLVYVHLNIFYAAEYKLARQSLLSDQY